MAHLRFVVQLYYLVHTVDGQEADGCVNRRGLCEQDAQDMAMPSSEVTIEHMQLTCDCFIKSIRKY